MDPLSPIPAILSLLAALATAAALAKLFGAPPPSGRNETIDGLRGFLALFVFLHHGSVWYFFLRTGVWKAPPSHLYTHFGQSGVALFFMITGFLFYSKLLNAKGKPIDWLRLFVSRVLRLTPLYLVAVGFIFLSVYILSNGALREPAGKLLVSAIRWIGFTVIGGPDLNGVERTWMSVAGVTWSLKFEWLFYLSLPLLALLAGVHVPAWAIVLGVIVGGAALRSPSIHYLSFLGGIVAAFIVRFPSAREFASTRLASFANVACVVALVAVFPTSEAVAPIALLSIIFALIACGNSLFGLFRASASRVLGEFAYGIYLLHGAVLFTLFKFILGEAASKQLTVLEHWSLMVSVTPLIVCVSFLAYRCIENPAMQKTNAATAMVRAGIKLMPFSSARRRV